LGLGHGSGWFFMTIVAILAIVGIVYTVKRR
jgi:uncharacterized membrane protein YccF (DUF307 family)